MVNSFPYTSLYLTLSFSLLYLILFNLSLPLPLPPSFNVVCIYSTCFSHVRPRSKIPLELYGLSVHFDEGRPGLFPHTSLSLSLLYVLCIKFMYHIYYTYKWNSMYIVYLNLYKIIRHPREFAHHSKKARGRENIQWGLLDKSIYFFLYTYLL